MSTLGISRTVDGVLTSADTTLITIESANGIFIVTLAPVTPVSAGVYTYDVTSLSPGNYTAQWTFQVSGQSDDIVTRVFSIDSPVAITQGITLAEIERGVARLIGPYHTFRCMVGSSIEQALVRKLISTLTIGDMEEMYLLRRGVYADKSQVIDFDTEDRQRIIDSYDNVLGALTPDSNWVNAPDENEQLELHALDPEDELRYAVIDGLSRCYFWDVATIAATGSLREVNLTELVPWITRREQVTRIEYGRSSYIPTAAPWFNTYYGVGSVYLQTSIPNVGSVRVHALRPHSTFVNGEYSGGGPDSDNDVLYIDKRYAVLAGHCQAWQNFPDRLAPLAVNGLRPDQKSVAAAFTQRSRAIIGGQPEFIQNRFGQDDILDNLQIGNL